MKPFYQLTTRGRARRLRPLALAALEHYDLDVKRLRLISNEVNGIFRLDTHDGEKYVLRICLPNERSEQEIRSEMVWLDALRRDTDLTTPYPLHNRQGDLLTTAKVAGVPEPRHCSIFGWIPGPDLAERLSAENMQKLGALAARMHAYSRRFTPPPDFTLKAYDKVFPYYEPVVLFDDAYQHFFPAERRAVYQQAVDCVQAAIDRLNADPNQRCVLHGDMHHWNIKIHRGKLYALDFEDILWGYPVQEIATTFYYFWGDDEFDEYLAAYKQGYTQHLPWPEQRPGEINTFIAGRRLMLINYVIQDPTPEYQEMAPNFVKRGEERFRAFLAQQAG